MSTTGVIVAVIVTALFGLAIGLVIGSIIQAKVQPAANAQPKAEKPETYGHPHPPVLYLRDRLPVAPKSHSWEIKTELNKQRRPELVLSLMDLRTGLPVESTSSDLLMGKYRTYADDYRSYPSIAGDLFFENFIGPLLDWANKQRFAYTAAEDSNLEYTTKTGDQ